MSLGLMEQLTHSTVRIETNLHDGGISTGTGFYMNFLQKADTCVPVIVTNKHVVANAKIGKFHVTLATNDGLPDTGKHQLFQFADFEQQCVKHPDPGIDLAAFLIGPLLNKAQQAGGKLFYIPLRTELIPKDEERETYSSMEDIVMIGYPNGIWDAKNNLPVIRKGITATHANVPWNGKKNSLPILQAFQALVVRLYSWRTLADIWITKATLTWGLIVLDCLAFTTPAQCIRLQEKSRSLQHQLQMCPCL
jgi:hypothetical protein